MSAKKANSKSDTKTDPKSVVKVEAVEVEEKNIQDAPLMEVENKMKVSNWFLIMGIGATVAAGTAVAVYYYRRKQRAKLAYEDEDYVGYSIDDYKSTFSRYWSLTKRTFEVVTASVTEFFQKTKFDIEGPMADAEKCRAGGPFMVDDSTDHDEVVLAEL